MILPALALVFISAIIGLLWAGIIKITFKFEPRDLWIGLYWNNLDSNELNIYICVIPVFPIHVRIFLEDFISD